MEVQQDVVEPSPSTQPDPLIAQLCALEAGIRSNGRDELRARWQFGRALVKLRAGAKKIPTGYLKRLTDEIGVSRQDIQARMKFAARYPDEAAFS